MVEEIEGTEHVSEEGVAEDLAYSLSRKGPYEIEKISQIDQ